MARGREISIGGPAALLAATAAGATLLVCAPQAFADLDFCPPGEGAGQCGPATGLNGLRGLSIDFETGRLYVADRTNNRVGVFTEEGKFVVAFGWGVADGSPELQSCGPATPEFEPAPSLCRKGLAGSGPGQLSGPTEVAVDNIAGSTSRHFVYVLDEGNKRIEKFGPDGEFVWASGGAGEAEGQIATGPSIGVGPGGAVHVLDNLPTAVSLKFKHRLQRLDPATGAPIAPQCILREGGRARDLAVAADGSFWVADDALFTVGGVPVESSATRKYNAACAELLVRDQDIAENTTLALDASGRVFVGQREERAKGGNSFRAIMARDAAGEPLARFAYGRVFNGKPEGLAVGAAGAFLAFGEGLLGEAGIRLLQEPSPPLPPPGPIAAPPSLEVVKAAAVKADVAAEVNPEGAASEVHFDYVSKAGYEKDKGEGGDGFEGAEAESSPVKPLGTEDFRLKAIEAQIGCPDPLSEAGHPGETAVEAGECLIPETEYRWRVVASNGDGGGEGTAEGPPFTTRSSPEMGALYSTEVGTDTARLSAEVNPWGAPTTGYFEYVDDAAFQADVKEGGEGFAAALKAPAGAPLEFGFAEDFVTRSITIHPLAPGTLYHYRMIADNPLVEAVAGEPETLRTFEAPEAPPCPNEGSRIGAGTLLPDCRAYEMVSPIDKEGGDIRVTTDEFAQRVVLEQASDSGERLAYGSSRSFGGALSGPITPQYLAERIPDFDGEYDPQEGWQSHSTNPPRGAPLFAAAFQFKSELKALSADLCTGWIATFAEFPAPTPPGYQPGRQNLLVRHDRLCGPESFAALAPLGEPEGAATGGLILELAGVSADGSHVAFTSNGRLDPDGHCEVNEGKQICARQLYESVGTAAPRLVCYLTDGTASPFPGSCTAGTDGQQRLLPGVISADGQRIFFSVGGATGAQPLYVRIGGTETVQVSATPATFWGASADGSTAIYTTGNLAGGAASLFSFDVDGETASEIAKGVRGVMGISEDAQRIYFASHSVLPGSGANSEGEEAAAGRPNLYFHEAGVGTRFIATLDEADVTATISEERYGKRDSRVSADGAHAAFASVATLTDYDNVEAGTSCGGTVAPGDPCPEIYRYAAPSGELSCVSCNPSGARPAGPSAIPEYQSPLHAARVLAEDGSRLYFESADRLSGRDSNGRIDVYQWEEPGTGGCGEGSYDFSERAEGCVSPISSGQGTQDSRLVESDPGGANVFFATVTGLLPQDPGLVDIYDARVNGGLPIPPPPKPPCEGDACAPQIAAPGAPDLGSEGYAAPTPRARAKGPRCRRGARSKARRPSRRAKGCRAKGGKRGRAGPRAAR